MLLVGRTSAAISSSIDSSRESSVCRLLRRVPTRGATGRPMAHMNILRIGGWNMCKNTEWIYCAARGRLAHGSGGSSGGDLIFSLAPKDLDLAPFYQKGGTGTPQGDGYYSENDIYYLEACVLNEICANRRELFSVERGARFRCEYDPAGHKGMQEALLQWEREDAPARCTGWECEVYRGVR